MPQASGGNRLLASLSRKDCELIEPDLEAIDLPLRYKMAQRNRRIEYVYFLDSGLGSVVVNGGGRPIEVGIVGREGMTAVGVLLGSKQSPHDVFMQVAGTGRRIRTDILCDADEHSLTLHRTLMRYVHDFFLQVTKTAQANGSSSIEERLARWLLMAQDRLDGEVLSLTHEFLSLMLGTPRPGVTVAVGRLAAEGLIESGRGKLRILDRASLEAKAKGIYEPPSDV
jgi:CRP-like cAMP-binding protein